MNLKEKLMSVIQKLGLTDKVKNNSLTHEDWSSIVDSYNHEFQANLRDDMAAEEAARQQEQATMSQEELNLLQAILVPEQQTGSDTSSTQQPATAQTVTHAAQQLANENADLQSQVEIMSRTAAPDTPEHIAVATLGINGPGTNAAYLFGIEHSIFSMDKRWNKIAANLSASSKWFSFKNSKRVAKERE